MYNHAYYTLLKTLANASGIPDFPNDTDSAPEFVGARDAKPKMAPLIESGIN